MKRCLFLLAMLGLRAWAFEVAYSVLRSHMQRLPAALHVASLAAIAEVGVPILALAVGIMAALYARRCHTSQWAVVFGTLATLAVVLPAIGLSLDHLLALSRAPNLRAAGRVAMHIRLLFPVLVFLPALIYAMRFRVAGRGAGGALTRPGIPLLLSAIPPRARILHVERRRAGPRTCRLSSRTSRDPSAIRWMTFAGWSAHAR